MFSPFRSGTQATGCAFSSSSSSSVLLSRWTLRGQRYIQLTDAVSTSYLYNTNSLFSRAVSDGIDLRLFSVFIVAKNEGDALSAPFPTLFSIVGATNRLKVQYRSNPATPELAQLQVSYQSSSTLSSTFSRQGWHVGFWGIGGGLERDEGE